MASTPRFIASGFGQGAELTAAIARTGTGSTIATAGGSGGLFDGAHIAPVSGAIVANVLVFIRYNGATRRVIGEYQIKEPNVQPDLENAAPPLYFSPRVPIELASAETIEVGMLKAGTTLHVTAAGGSY